jgi:hypothetical protein
MVIRTKHGFVNGTATVLDNKVNGAAVVPSTKWALDHGTPTKVERAFAAADWASGRLPYRPTIAEAAARAGVSPTYACHALHRQTEREEIIAGRIPLIPSSGPSSSEARDRKRLARMANKRGVSGVLELLADIEATTGTTAPGNMFSSPIFGNGNGGVHSAL